MTSPSKGMYSDWRDAQLRLTLLSDCIDQEEDRYQVHNTGPKIELRPGMLCCLVTLFDEDKRDPAIITCYFRF